MRSDSKVWLNHIREAAAAIQRFTSGTTFALYAVDPMRQAAVERHFITIGEATRRLRDGDRDTVARISEYPEIIALRNYLVHEYQSVQTPMVWEAVEFGLPRLVHDVETLLEGADAQ